MCSLLWRSILAEFIKSMLDRRYSGRVGTVLVVCCKTSPGEYASSSSSMMIRRFWSWAASLARMRASSINFTRVARMECGQSTGPFALATPRAILSRRFEGGTTPLNGVKRCAGNASSVCGVVRRALLRRDGAQRRTRASRRVCSGFQSDSGSSWFELFQLSVLFLFAAGTRNATDARGGVRVIGVCGADSDADRFEDGRRGRGGCGRAMANGES